MGDKTKGLLPEGKFYVERRDGNGSHPEDKHYLCQYFVLDLTHDRHAIPALLAYAESSRKDGYHELAKDLENLAIDAEQALENTPAVDTIPPRATSDEVSL